LSKLGTSPAVVGIALTLVIASSSASNIFVSLMADRLGRRRSLLAFTILGAISALLFLSSPHPGVVVVAAVLGNLSLSVTEAGPLPSLEQAALPSCCSDHRRNLLFSIYNFVGYGASSLGALLSGLPELSSSMPVHEAFLPLFGIFLAGWALDLVAYSRLSGAIELRRPRPHTRWRLRPESRPIVARLALLFGLDAFAGGFVVQSIISYWFYLRFHTSLNEIGAIFFVAQAINALSLLLAARIAGRIGLVNTMVFTHIASNILLMAIPVAQPLWVATAVLWARHSVSQMDVPTRQSYLVAVVDPSDRTAAAGLTNVARMASQSVSPSLGGYSMQFLHLGAPFFLGGGLKIVYDLLLYSSFRRLKPPEERRSPAR